MSTRRQRLRSQKKSASSANGLWRDRNYLVIDLHEHTFPARCLKSNLPVETPQESVVLWSQSVAPLEIDRLEEHDESLDSGRVRIAHGHKSGTTVEVRLQLPLHPGWRRLINWPWGNRLAAVGGLGAGFTLLAGLLATQIPSISLPRNLWGWAIVSSLALLFLGLFLNLCLSWILPIRRIEEHKVWLGGVHRDWLQSLPQFVPSAGMLIRELEIANWKFWPLLGVGLVLVIFCFITILSVHADSLGRFVIAVYLIGIALTILNANSTSGHILRTRRRLEELYLSRVRRRGKQRR